MHFDVVEDDRVFDSMQPEWDELLSASRQDGPFLRHAWLRAWWRAFGERDRLSILTCREAPSGRLIGVLPAFTTQAGRILPGRKARFLGDFGVGSTGLTPFADPDAEDEAFGAFASALRDPRRWDVLDLAFVEHGSAFFRLATEDAGCGGRDTAVRVWPAGVSPRIPLPGDWDTYCATLSRVTRQNVRRRMRKVRDRGGEVELVRDLGALPEAFGDFIRLHETRMRQKLGPGYTVSEASRRFMAESMRDLLAEDRLRLMFLVIGGVRVAVVYSFRYHDTMYFVQSGFDVAEARSAVCRALLGFSIQAAIEEGCAWFDMLLGDQQYKTEWGASEVRSFCDVRAYNGTPAAALMNAKDAAIEWRRRSGERDARGESAAAPTTPQPQPDASAVTPED